MRLVIAPITPQPTQGRARLIIVARCRTGQFDTKVMLAKVVEAPYPGIPKRQPMTNQQEMRQLCSRHRLQSGQHPPSRAHQFLREIQGHGAEEFIPAEKYLFSEHGRNICRLLARRLACCRGNPQHVLAPSLEIPQKAQ